MFKITRLLSYLAALDETRTECQRPIFGAKLEAWRHEMFHIFHFLQSKMAFGIEDPFREYSMPSPVRKSCVILMSFLLTEIDSGVIPAC